MSAPTAVLLALLGLSPGRAAPPPQPTLQPALRDRWGDPLPPFAISRLGTVRFRRPRALGELAFSPDGAAVAVSSADGLVLAWAVATGERVLCATGHPKGADIPVAYSPDGKLLLTGGWDGVVRCFDARTGREHTRWLAHTDCVDCLVLSHDGKVLLTAGDEGKVHLWEWPSRRRLRSLPWNAQFDSRIALAPDGTRVLIKEGEHILCWDVQNGRRLYDQPCPSGLPLAISRSGSLFACCDPDGGIALHRVSDGRLVRWLRGHRERVLSFCFGPNDLELVSGAGDETVRIWSVKDGREKARLPGLHGSPWYVCFSPDGKLLATGDLLCGAVRVWDRATCVEKTRRLGHAAWVNAVTFLPSGNRVVTGCQDGTVRLWDPLAGTCVRDVQAQSTLFRAIAASGGRFATASYEGEVILWDATRMSPAWRFVGSAKPVTALAFYPRGDALVSTSFDGWVRVHDIETGKETHRSRSPGKYPTAAIVSPDGQEVVCLSDSGVDVWTPRTGGWRRLAAPAVSPGHPWARFLADGDLLIESYVEACALRIWDWRSGKLLRQIKHSEGGLNAVALSPDEQFLALGTDNGQIQLLYVPGGQRLRTYTGHAGRINGLSFSPDGSLLVSASNDTTGLVWDLAGSNIGRHTSCLWCVE